MCALPTAFNTPLPLSAADSLVRRSRSSRFWSSISDNKDASFCVLCVYDACCRIKDSHRRSFSFRASFSRSRPSHLSTLKVRLSYVTVRFVELLNNNCARHFLDRIVERSSELLNARQNCWPFARIVERLSELLNARQNCWPFARIVECSSDLLSCWTTILPDSSIELLSVHQNCWTSVKIVPQFWRSFNSCYKGSIILTNA